MQTAPRPVAPDSRPPEKRNHWVRYSGALLAFGLALAARFALADVLPPTGFPFLTFFPAVILTAFLGGLGPGLLVAALSVAAADYFFIPPHHSLSPGTVADTIALVFFGVVLLVDCIVIHLMTTSLARVRAERARNAELAEARRELAAELALRLAELGGREDELRMALLEGEAVLRRLETSEARLRELNQSLEMQVETAVAAREAALMRAAQAERLHALGQLAGGIAHDFNNVLQVVGGAASLIERRAEDVAGVRKLARLVAQATERGAAVTNRMLAFARRGELRAMPVDAAALLEGLRDILAHTLGQPIAIRLDLAAPLPLLLVDKAQLETVLVNLATNARDAMPEGGTLTFSAQSDQVGPPDQDGPRPGPYLRLVVTDTGTGMPPEVLARIAEPFFTTKGVGRGTGLGLAMARGFVEQSGGGLAVESRVGHGTTVTLWLPQRASAIQGTRVLLVDDEAPVRQMLEAELEQLGCAVIAVASGEAALPLLAGPERIDLLLTDLSMPGMTGLALIRHARISRPALPAVLLTGFGGDVAGPAEAGEFTLLRKPVGSAELGACLDGLLRNEPNVATRNAMAEGRQD